MLRSIPTFGFKGRNTLFFFILRGGIYNERSNRKRSNSYRKINKAVKRNINRFPNDFYFQLKSNEYKNLKFQFGTSSENNHGGVRKLPYVFTEQGVAMLASVLHTAVAEEVSIRIMRSFVKMRKYFANNTSNIVLLYKIW